MNTSLTLKPSKFVQSYLWMLHGLVFLCPVITGLPWFWTLVIWLAAGASGYWQWSCPRVTQLCFQNGHTAELTFTNGRRYAYQLLSYRQLPGAIVLHFKPKFSVLVLRDQICSRSWSKGCISLLSFKIN